MRFGRFRRAALAPAAVAVAAVLAAGGCTGSDESPSAPKSLEKTELRVGALPIIDDAPLYIAIQKGYFADEGLKVTPQVVQGGALALPKLAKGALDISFANYVSVFKAQAAGGRFHILAEGYQARPNVMGIVARSDQSNKSIKSNPIAEPKDLAGKTIAVNTFNNVGTLTIASALSTSDVRPSSVKFKEVPFPNMAKALADGVVDAAWMVEPFITSAAESLGAQLVLDTASGPTADLPVAGYVCTASFAEKYPRTAAAFRRAIRRAQEAAADRQNVERVLTSYVPKIDPETAVITGVGVFPSTEEPSPVRLQRVADLMQQFQMLPARLDVKNLTE